MGDELELCNWNLKGMTCVRLANHRGNHWVWESGSTGFQVWERIAGTNTIRPLYHASTRGSFTREEVAAVVQYFDYMAKRRKRK